jgi:CP family cyanate transporter-like MFS transporter
LRKARFVEFRENPVTASRSLPISLGLLWLVGTALRLSILAVPPIIPALRGEFNLSGTEIGILTGLPIVLFAAAALAGSRLVARIGAVPAVVAGLLLTAVGSALRGIASDVTTLFAATAVMGGGVAVTQPALPALVGRWLPRRRPRHRHLHQRTSCRRNTAGSSVSAVVSACGASWRATFVLWAVPIAAIALPVMAVAPCDTSARIVIAPRWLPDWPARDIFRLGLIFGSASALYYAGNAFLPGHLIEAGHSDLINPALTALNLGQLPASFVLIGFGRQLERRVWPFVVTGVLSLICIALIVVTASAVTVASTAVFGFAIGAAFALCLTLPPLLSTSGEVARVSAAMFTISYASAMGVSILSGVAWDVTGVERFAFLPIALSALPLILLVSTIGFDRKAADAQG